MVSAVLVWREARDRAAEVLRVQWDGSLPVDPFRIAERLGIEVYEKNLGSEVSGEIIQTGSNDVRINISVRDPEVRQVFTVAHEIGHFIERNVVADDPEYSFVDERNPSRYDLHEFFADEFAGALLMPEDSIMPEFETETSLLRVAKMFGVSVAAVNTRKRNLRKYGG